MIDLTARIAFQEREIGRLQEAVRSQQKQIDRLTTLCEALRRKVAAPPEEPLPDSEKPPHYR
ncbi:MAG TPA: SlyX family protein [Planctomycetota bacterium]|nr:SlyX family protein [Planctomycetota bacterium]